GATPSRSPTATHGSLTCNEFEAVTSRFPPARGRTVWSHGSLHGYSRQASLSLANLTSSFARARSKGSSLGHADRSPIRTVGWARPRRMQFAAPSHRLANARKAVRGCLMRADDAWSVGKSPQMTHHPTQPRRARLSMAHTDT